MAERLAAVRECIARAADRVGRDPESVRLVLVTKRQPLARIREAIAAGVRCFGENRLEEAEGKVAALDPSLEWHMIGHLQSRKAKRVGALFQLIHSVDDPKTAQAIADSRPPEAGPQEVLLQVNVSGEQSKTGVSPDGVKTLLDAILEEPRVRTKGLMTMAPADANGQELHHAFGQLRELRDHLSEQYAGDVDLPELSMGMSGDYEIAIEEGATLVRIGSAILGAREE